jgi:hypothetical protein
VKDENDENDDGARERKLAGKTKEKGNCRGRPLGSTGKGINRATFQSPVRTSHTSRSKSAPHSSTRRNGDKRLLSLDKREATCLSRGHPFNLICSNCRENSNAHSAGQAQKQCEQLFIFDNCTNNRKKASFNHIKEWEEKRLSTGLTDLHGSATPALKKDDAVVVENASGSKLCRGIATGQSHSLLAFVSNAVKATARYLDRCASGDIVFAESEYAQSGELLLPFRGVVVKRATETTGFTIEAPGCQIITRNDRRSEMCQECKDIYSVTRAAVAKAKSVQPGTLPHPKTKIQAIATNEILADSELRRLREEVRRQRRQIAMLQNRKHLERYGKKPIDSKANKIIQDVFEKANGPAEKFLEDKGDEEELDLWKVHFESLKETHKKGGRTSGSRYDPRLLNWAIGLLAKTSHSVYEDIQKVMQLPSRSYVMRKSAELVSTHGTKAHSMCLNTLATVAQRLTELGHVPGSNGRRGCIAVDAANCLSGLEWDRIGHKMVGTDPTLCFEVVSKQFKAMAADAAMVDDGEEEEDVCNRNQSSIMQLKYFCTSTVILYRYRTLTFSALLRFYYYRLIF